ncbi:MAG: hypothetical protein LQ351_002924 [Letrouitia transgressa]|nr:MAG: hypothetical protein LQ351_002924 [Letrouitia transgressa]
MKDQSSKTSQQVVVLFIAPKTADRDERIQGYPPEVSFPTTNVSANGESSLLAGLESLTLVSPGASTSTFSATSSTSVMSSSSGTPESWITSFCSLLGHEYFAEVSEDFIEDDFNLTGLQNQVPMYKEALEMILDVEPEEDEDEDEEEEEEEEEEEDEDNDAIMRGEDGEKLPGGYRRASERRQMRLANDLSVIESSAELLYGLIHQRYITSRPGIQQMADKYELQQFGVCPRVFCNSARVLPVGCSDIPGQETVKLFCPSCLDVYTPPNSRFQSVDGAFFGTTFGCLFFMTFPEYDVSTKGDPLNLAIINPVFGASQGGPEIKSRSSSLTSTPVPSNPAAPTSSDSPAPPSLPPQPLSINGVATINIAPGLGPGKIHENRIYGFRVAERSRTGPRMKWLRDRPEDMNELDEGARYHDMYGGDPEGDMAGAIEAANGAAQFEQVSRRKKAPMRKRRRGVEGSGTNGLGVDAG